MTDLKGKGIKFLKRFDCEHRVTHTFGIHTCDGCCARVYLEATEDREQKKGKKND